MNCELRVISTRTEERKRGRLTPTQVADIALVVLLSCSSSCIAAWLHTFRTPNLLVCMLTSLNYTLPSQLFKSGDTERLLLHATSLSLASSRTILLFYCTLYSRHFATHCTHLHSLQLLLPFNANPNKKIKFLKTYKKYLAVQKHS